MERAGSGAQWRIDEFDQVHGTRLVPRTSTCLDRPPFALVPYKVPFLPWT